MPAATSSARVSALDGLRGLAALVVVVHHSVLALPSLADAYRSGRHPAEGASAWLVYSPLHLLWNGPAAVLVFFVLSGYVLTLSMSRPTASWVAYLPSRLVRLYLPTTAAVAWAVLTFAVVPHVARRGASWWVNRHAVDVTPGRVLDDVLLVRGTNFLDSPLWSLRWEVVFSLLLPLYVLLGRRTGRGWPGALLVLLAAVGLGRWLGSSWTAVYYLPMFGLGSVLAAQRDHVGAWVDRVAWPRRGGAWAVVLGLGLLSTRWLLVGTGFTARLPQSIGAAAEVAGALLLVGAAVWSPAVRRRLGHPVLAWLGSRSFSVYLTHEPIAVCVAMVLGVEHQRLTVLVTLPLALLVGELFFRAVERPSHRLSRAVARPLQSSSRRVPVSSPTG